MSIRHTVPNWNQRSTEFSVIAGPCSVESLEQFHEIAVGVHKFGATALRGGIYKMRTRPDAFQGLGPQAYGIVESVSRVTGLPMVAEITDPRQIEGLYPVVAVFQVGARNMHNYELLKELGKLDKPVLLKRGLSAYFEEWISAAEYVIRGGNPNVIFCERGIRTFERGTRNTLDLSAVPFLKSRTGLPVFVDPSHGTGLAELVTPMCLAAAAAGADGLLIEVHSRPEASVSDREQALSLGQFAGMMEKLKTLLPALGRELGHVPIRVPRLAQPVPHVIQ